MHCLVLKKLGHVQLLLFSFSFQEAKALLRRHKLESHLLQAAAAGLGYAYTEPVRPGGAVPAPQGLTASAPAPCPSPVNPPCAGDSGAGSWPGLFPGEQ